MIQTLSKETHRINKHKIGEIREKVLRPLNAPSLTTQVSKQVWFWTSEGVEGENENPHGLQQPHCLAHGVKVTLNARDEERAENTRKRFR